MAVNIGLMGFGRIGRNLFRILHKDETMPIAAISDIADHGCLEYLLRFDTILGRFPSEVSIKDGHLYAAGRQIPMLSAESGGDVDWKALGVDTVIEATARPRSREQLERHLKCGARRVIMCVPPTSPPDITVVMGVNDRDIKPEHRIVSNASSTAHAAAPVLKILDRAFGIERAFLSTVHAYTNKLRLADVPTVDMRSGRAAAENIIPQASDSAQVVIRMLPELEGKLSSIAMNVPVPNGSVVDLVCWHEKPVTETAINEVVRTAVSDEWAGIVDYEGDPIVSTDILQSPYSGTFDSQSTMTLGPKISKTLIWFDNGWGYAHRVVDLIRRFDALEQEAA